MELSERKKQILRAVVENYIQTAEPVGSKAIVVSAGLKVSSATIRNEMAELETLGYLEQPHTSAGRIPSPKGYRLYVNELMEEHRLTMQEAQKINEALNLKIREMDQVMTEAGKIISQLTKYPTFSLTKGTRKATIARYDLLMVEESAFIAVLMTDGQMVKNKLFRLPTPLSETQLQLLGTLLNTSFTGLTLEELGPELARVASHAGGEAYGLISLVVSFAMEVLEELGKMPLPPYIKAELSDPERYQTVYSREVGSAAAPTAGLHFTRALLEQVQEMGVKVCYVTLHVGLGTFRPVKEEEITDHEMHSEYCMISAETAETINRTKREGGRVICVGTTSCRTIESWAAEDGTLKECAGWTNIFIYPGYRFKALDCLITNFHLPESTLIMLVSALAGREHVLAAYKEAVEQRYRFFSFGDAMFIG